METLHQRDVTDFNWRDATVTWLIMPIACFKSSFLYFESIKFYIFTCYFFFFAIHF
jgi:hypothetical protein